MILYPLFYIKIYYIGLKPRINLSFDINLQNIKCLFIKVNSKRNFKKKQYDKLNPKIKITFNLIIYNSIWDIRLKSRINWNQINNYNSKI